MNLLTLSDVSLGLEDLFKTRAEVLHGCKAGQIYGVLLRRSLDEIKNIPPVLLTSRPLVDELNEVDAAHDSGVLKMRAVTSAIIDDPLAEKEIKEAALRIRRDLVPSGKIVNAPYSTEAFNAKERRLKLAEREEDLRLFPLPGGKTLYDAAVQFLDAGDELDALLSERSKLEAVSESDRSKAGHIRNAVVGYLVRFEIALADELEADAKLERNLSAQILGYFTQMNESRRAQRQSQEASAKKGTK